MKLTSMAGSSVATYGSFTDDEMMARSYRAAQLISIVALPPLLAILTIIALSSQAITDPLEAVRVMVISSFFIAVMPVVYIAYLLRTNRIAGGVDLAHKEERWRPYLVGIGSCVLGFLILMWLHAPGSILLLTLCYAVNSSVMAIITQRWKISAHAAGAALPATALVSFFGAAALAFAVIVPMVCWARVKVKMHTVAQVSMGALIGTLLTWLQLTLLGPRF